jgi:glycosyltransferase involved in cell wall biosynthesis
MKKNVCMIVYTVYSIDARVRREAETLTEAQDYAVSVITLKEGLMPESRIVQGVRVYEVNLSKYQGKSSARYLKSYIIFLFLAFLKCNGFLMKKTLDIVHVHNMPNFLVFSAIIPVLFGKKLILDIHDTVLETYISKFKGITLRIIYWILRFEETVSCALAHKIICVNHVQRDVLIKRGIPQRKIMVSINVPDPKLFLQRSNGNGKRNKSSGFHLVYHGTLAKRLGIDLTIRAVARLLDKIPGLEFHIVGNGDDKREFIELSRNLGIDDRVNFANNINLSELMTTLNDMDLGIISNRENIATELMLPVKMLEYIALDIPVIAPRLKAIQYYFTEEMVGYYEPENVESLADVIFESFKNERLRNQRVIKARRFLDEYGWDKHKFDFINLYDTVLRS